MKKVNCLIIDDHVIFTNAMQMLLGSFDMIGEVLICPNGNDGIAMLQKDKSIQLLFLDLHMPKINGFEVLSEIKEKNIGVNCIIMSSVIDPIVISKTLELGAKGYLPKSCDLNELRQAILTVLNQETYVSTEFTKDIQRIASNSTERFLENDLSKTYNNLSDREKEIVKMVAQGMQNKEIAEKLFISPLTVKTHRHNILQKLNLNNSAALIRFVTEMGLV